MGPVRRRRARELWVVEQAAASAIARAFGTFATVVYALFCEWIVFPRFSISTNV